jgi:hypothetical protein
MIELSNGNRIITEIPKKMREILGKLNIKIRGIKVVNIKKYENLWKIVVWQISQLDLRRVCFKSKKFIIEIHDYKYDHFRKS